MNLFVYPATCTICGQTGLAHARYMGEDWLGTKFTHRDPMVCAENLAYQRRQAAYKAKQEHEKAQEPQDYCI